MKMSSRGRFATPADFPLQDCSPCTEGNTYDTELWALSLVQGPLSVALCQTLIVRFATFSPPYAGLLTSGRQEPATPQPT
jgi:hypothetical protein